MAHVTLEIMAYHGWGFDQTCWQAWKDRLAQSGIRLTLFDRGYFHTPVSPAFGDQGQDDRQGHRVQRMVWTHSFGLHLCPIAHLQQADLLVIFSGFQDFHPAPESLRRRSQQMLDRMLQQFRQQPQTVLQNFKSKCYQPQSWHGDEHLAANLELLAADLEHLGSSVLAIDRLQEIPQVLILHGTADRIVSPQKGRAWAEKLPSNSQYFEIEGAGHALPFTHVSHCWSLIQPFMPSFDDPVGAGLIQPC